MRKLSEIYGDEAVDVLAELLDPAFVIMNDKEFRAIFENHEPVVNVARYIVKNYRSEAMHLLTVLSGEEEYKPSVIGLIKDVASLFEDEELIDFFDSQAQ